MPIVAADLKAWLSVATPENDTDVSGGIIQDDNHATGGIRCEFVDISATGTVEVLSDGADTRTITVTGRLASGAIASEALVLNGTTPVTSANSYERILKSVLSVKDAARTVTVRKASDDVTIMTLGINVIACRRMFYDAASEAAQVDRYEIVYLQNDHATLTLNAAAVKLTGDPAAKLFQAVAAAKGDVASVANRKTVPPGVTFVDDNVSQSVPTGTLAAQERIGTWLRQRLAAADSAFKNTWTLELSGTTT